MHTLVYKHTHIITEVLWNNLFFYYLHFTADDIFYSMSFICMSRLPTAFLTVIVHRYSWTNTVRVGGTSASKAIQLPPADPARTQLHLEWTLRFAFLWFFFPLWQSPMPAAAGKQTHTKRRQQRWSMVWAFQNETKQKASFWAQPSLNWWWLNLQSKQGRILEKPFYKEETHAKFPFYSPPFSWLFPPCPP